jgi:hypothetical protein
VDVPPEAVGDVVFVRLDARGDTGDVVADHVGVLQVGEEDPRGVRGELLLEGGVRGPALLRAGVVPAGARSWPGRDVTGTMPRVSRCRNGAYAYSSVNTTVDGSVAVTAVSMSRSERSVESTAGSSTEV